MKKYYSFEMSANGKSADIYIFGDITSFPIIKSDLSSYNLSVKLSEIGNVERINVYISSYGGEVSEGLAIYNALKRHNAKVVTYCEGFACSIASVIFMAGDERIMNDSSLLMIHNAWSCCEGNAEQLRKEADDLEKITQASVIAYKAHSKLTEDEIKALMDAETWILPSEALEYGFATGIEETEAKTANQSVKMSLLEIIKQSRKVAGKAPKEGDDYDTENKGEKQLFQLFNAILKI